MFTEKESVPLPVTLVQVKTKVFCPPVGIEEEAGDAGPQSAAAVPVPVTLIPGATESAVLPLLAIVAVTVMVSPGLTVLPLGPEAASPPIVRATRLTRIDS